MGTEHCDWVHQSSIKNSLYSISPDHGQQSVSGRSLVAANQTLDLKTLKNQIGWFNDGLVYGRLTRGKQVDFYTAKTYDGKR